VACRQCGKAEIGQRVEAVGVAALHNPASCGFLGKFWGLFMPCISSLLQLLASPTGQPFYEMSSTGGTVGHNSYRRISHVFGMSVPPTRADDDRRPSLVDARCRRYEEGRSAATWCLRQISRGICRAPEPHQKRGRWRPRDFQLDRSR
jgi:hypothetical protein